MDKTPEYWIGYNQGHVSTLSLPYQEAQRIDADVLRGQADAAKR